MYLIRYFTIFDHPKSIKIMSKVKIVKEGILLKQLHGDLLSYDTHFFCETAPFWFRTIDKSQLYG